MLLKVFFAQIRLMATVRANTGFAPATPLPSIFALIEQRAAAGPLLKVFFTFNVYLSARWRTPRRARNYRPHNIQLNIDIAVSQAVPRAADQLVIPV
jgi:hypothetical protein